MSTDEKEKIWRCYFPGCWFKTTVRSKWGRHAHMHRESKAEDGSDRDAAATPASDQSSDQVPTPGDMDQASWQTLPEESHLQIVCSDSEGVASEAQTKERKLPNAATHLSASVKGVPKKFQHRKKSEEAQEVKDAENCTATFDQTHSRTVTGDCKVLDKDKHVSKILDTHKSDNSTVTRNHTNTLSENRGNGTKQTKSKQVTNVENDAKSIEKAVSFSVDKDIPVPNYNRSDSLLKEIDDTEQQKESKDNNVSDNCTNDRLSPQVTNVADESLAASGEPCVSRDSSSPSGFGQQGRDSQTEIRCYYPGCFLVFHSRSEFGKHRISHPRKQDSFNEVNLERARSVDSLLSYIHGAKELPSYGIIKVKEKKSTKLMMCIYYPRCKYTTVDKNELIAHVHSHEGIGVCSVAGCSWSSDNNKEFSLHKLCCIWKEMGKRKCLFSSCLFEAYDSETFCNHVKMDHLNNMNVIVCVIPRCTFMAYDAQGYRMHVRTTHPQMFLCIDDTCSFLSPYSNIVELHKDFHRSGLVDTPIANPVTITALFKCDYPLCNFTTLSADVYKTHVCNHRNVQVCGFKGCSFATTSSETMQSHRVSHVFLAAPVHSCSIEGCVYKTTHLEDYISHMEKHNSKQMSCGFSKCSFTSNDCKVLLRHRLQHVSQGDVLEATDVQDALATAAVQHQQKFGHSFDSLSSSVPATARPPIQRSDSLSDPETLLAMAVPSSLNITVTAPTAIYSCATAGAGKQTHFSIDELSRNQRHLTKQLSIDEDNVQSPQENSVSDVADFNNRTCIEQNPFSAAQSIQLESKKKLDKQVGLFDSKEITVGNQVNVKKEHLLQEELQKQNIPKTISSTLSDEMAGKVIDSSIPSDLYSGIPSYESHYVCVYRNCRFASPVADGVDSMLQHFSIHMFNSGVCRNTSSGFRLYKCWYHDCMFVTSRLSEMDVHLKEHLLAAPVLRVAAKRPAENTSPAVPTEVKKKKLAENELVTEVKKRKLAEIELDDHSKRPISSEDWRVLMKCLDLTCGYKATEFLPLVQHLRLHSTVLGLSDEENNLLESTTKYMLCKQIDCSFETKRVVCMICHSINHLRYLQQEKKFGYFYCSDCDYLTWTFPEMLQQHVQLQHKNVKSVSLIPADQSVNDNDQNEDIVVIRQYSQNDVEAAIAKLLPKYLAQNFDFHIHDTAELLLQLFNSRLFTTLPAQRREPLSNQTTVRSTDSPTSAIPSIKRSLSSESERSQSSCVPASSILMQSLMGKCSTTAKSFSKGLLVRQSAVTTDTESSPSVSPDETLRIQKNASALSSQRSLDVPQPCQITSTGRSNSVPPLRSFLDHGDSEARERAVSPPTFPQSVDDQEAKITAFCCICHDRNIELSVLEQHLIRHMNPITLTCNVCMYQAVYPKIAEEHGKLKHPQLPLSSLFNRQNFCAFVDDKFVMRCSGCSYATVNVADFADHLNMWDRFSFSCARCSQPCRLCKKGTHDRRGGLSAWHAWWIEAHYVAYHDEVERGDIELAVALNEKFADQGCTMHAAILASKMRNPKAVSLVDTRAAENFYARGDFMPEHTRLGQFAPISSFSGSTTDDDHDDIVEKHDSPSQKRKTLEYISKQLSNRQKSMGFEFTSDRNVSPVITHTEPSGHTISGADSKKTTLDLSKPPPLQIIGTQEKPGQQLAAAKRLNFVRAFSYDETLAVRYISSSADLDQQDGKNPKVKRSRACLMRSDSESKATSSRSRNLHPIEITCTLCEGKVIVESSLSRHVKQHAVNIPFTCSVCTYMAVSGVQLEEHRLVQHPNLDLSDIGYIPKKDEEGLDNLPYRCNWCPFACNTSNRLTRHIWNHIRFECSECHLESDNLQTIKSHHQVVHSTLKATSIIMHKVDCLPEDVTESSMEDLKQRYRPRKRVTWSSVVGNNPNNEAAMPTETTKKALKQRISSGGSFDESLPPVSESIADERK